MCGEKTENFSHFSSLFNNKTEKQSTSLKNETDKYADKNRPCVAYIDFLVVCQQSKTASAYGNKQANKQTVKKAGSASNDDEISKNKIRLLKLNTHVPMSQ